VLYTDWQSDFTSECGSTPHPVVKKTAKRVFVKRPAGRLLALDRGVLEAEGRAWSHPARDFFYTQPYEVRHADQIAEERRFAGEREGRRIDEMASFTEAELRAAAEVARRAGVAGLDTLAVAEVLRFMNTLTPGGHA